MEIEALRTFLAIQRSGGFSSAGEALGRSQPAISRRIALLEEALGVPLFERMNGRIALSEAGRTLAPLARRAVAAHEECRAAIDALKDGAGGTVSLALVGTLAGAGLTRVLRQFRARFPGVELAIRTATSVEVSRLVRTGETVMGLRYYADPSDDLACETITQERRRIVCAPDHPCAGREVESLRSLDGERWLAFPTAAPPREGAPDTLFAHLLVAGVAEPLWTPVDSLTAQKRLVEAGYGIAVLPESAIAEELAAGSLAMIDVAGVAFESPVCLVTRRDGYLSPAARRFAELLRAPMGAPTAPSPPAG